MINLYAFEESERDWIIAVKQYDVAMKKVAYLESALEARLAYNLAQAELKVMTESAEDTYISDLAMLIKEAAEENEEKSGGALSSIWEAICNLFKSVWNFLSSPFRGKEGQLKAVGADNTAITIGVDLPSIGKSVSNVRGAVDSGNSDTIKKAVAAATGTAAALGVGYLVVKGKKEGGGFQTTTGAVVDVYNKIVADLKAITDKIATFAKKNVPVKDIGTKNFKGASKEEVDTQINKNEDMISRWKKELLKAEAAGNKKYMDQIQAKIDALQNKSSTVKAQADVGSKNDKILRQSAEAEAKNKRADKEAGGGKERFKAAVAEISEVKKSINALNSKKSANESRRANGVSKYGNGSTQANNINKNIDADNGKIDASIRQKQLEMQKIADKYGIPLKNILGAVKESYMDILLGNFYYEEGMDDFMLEDGEESSVSDDLKTILEKFVSIIKAVIGKVAAMIKGFIDRGFQGEDSTKFLPDPATIKSYAASFWGLAKNAIKDGTKAAVDKAADIATDLADTNARTAENKMKNEKKINENREKYEDLKKKDSKLNNKLKNLYDSI